MSLDPEKFGTGSYVGTIMRDEAFFSRPVTEQAEHLGWAAGCPIVQELIDPENPNPGRGPDAMRDRYAEVGFWHRYIMDRIEDRNPGLYLKFTVAEPRLFSEPVGKYELESVPNDYELATSGLCTLAGYATARLFLAHLKAKDDTELDPDDFDANRVAQLDTGHTALGFAMFNSRTPEVFLVRFAESLTRKGADTAPMLQHMLGAGWIEEQHGYAQLTRVKRAMLWAAPNLLAAYTSLSADDKAVAKLL